MSINSEHKELEEILDRTLDNLLRDAQPGISGAALRQQVGIVRGSFVKQMYAGTFATEFLKCFTLVLDTKMKLASLVYVHQHLFDEEPVGQIAKAVVQASILFCLSVEATMVSAEEFISRDDVEAMMATVKLAFDEARDLAADAVDSSVYQALTYLAGALTQHLVATARPLPRMVSFHTSTNYPALTLSQRVYYTAERWLELYQENKVIHPLFFPTDVRGLSE